MRSPRLFALLVALFVASVAVGPAALAQDPGEVADAVRTDGVYVDDGLGLTEAEIGEYVAAVRNAGEALSIVVLLDEPVGGATTFADAVFDQLGSGVVLVIGAESDGYAGILEEFTEAEFEAALQAAADVAESDTEFLDVFVTDLTGAAAPAAATDGPAPAPEPAASSEGGGLGLLFWLILIGGGVLLFFWWRRRRETAAGPKLSPQMIEAKDKIQDQINAVANDIIDLEDEVRLADDPQADEFYQTAGATYTDVVESFPAANAPEALLDLSNRLDEAVWQLDSAEAVLDGKPLPPKPAPQQLPIPEPATDAAPPTPVPGDRSLPPRPQYDRRPSRRSRYGGGGGLMDLLIGMAGSMMAGRMRTGARPSPRQRRVQNPVFPPVPTKSSPIPTPANPRGGRRSSPSGSTSRGRTMRSRSRGGVRRGRRRRR